MKTEATLVDPESQVANFVEGYVAEVNLETPVQRHCGYHGEFIGLSHTGEAFGTMTIRAEGGVIEGLPLPCPTPQGLVGKRVRVTVEILP